MHFVTRTAAVLLGVAVALGGAAPAFAQALGRATGTVTDSAGNPLAGVTITVTSPEFATLKLEKTTNKKGKYTIAVADATVTYDVRLEKEGYLTLIDKVKASVGGFNTKDFVMLTPAEGQAPAATGTAVGEGGGGTAGLSRAAIVYNEGAEAQAAGNLELAESRFREACSLDPSLAAPHTGLASVALQRSQFAEAAALAEGALAIDPSDFRALHVRFEAYRQLGDAAKAAEAAEALKKAGAGGDAAKRLFNEAAEAYNSGNLPVAKSKFEQVITLDPELVPAYLALGAIYLQHGQGAAALAMAEEALAREPANVRAMQMRYDAARTSGDAQATSTALAALVAADPHWAATELYQQAVQRFNSDDAAGAKVLLEQVLASSPEHARAHYTMGLVMLNLGDVPNARQHLQRFLELAPADADAANAKAMLDSLG